MEAKIWEKIPKITKFFPTISLIKNAKIFLGKVGALVRYPKDTFITWVCF